MPGTWGGSRGGDSTATGPRPEEGLAGDRAWTEKNPGVIRGLVLGMGVKTRSLELVVHADLGNRELVLEIGVHNEGRATGDTKIEVVGFVLLVELDVVVFDEGGPVLSDHVLITQADQPTPRRAFRAGQLLSCEHATAKDSGD